MLKKLIMCVASSFVVAALAAGLAGNFSVGCPSNCIGVLGAGFACLAMVACERLCRFVNSD